MKIYTAASLQFTKIRSAIVSSLRGSGSSRGGSDSERSERSKSNWRRRGITSDRDRIEQFSESHVELQRVKSTPSLRSVQYEPKN